MCALMSVYTCVRSLDLNGREEKVGCMQRGGREGRKKKKRSEIGRESDRERGGTERKMGRERR